MTSDAPNVLLICEDGERIRQKLQEELSSFYHTQSLESRLHDVPYIMIVDCVREQSINHVRNQITFFTKAVVKAPRGLRKTVVLLDGGWLSREAQSALRRIIELRNHTTRFVMTSRDGKGILGPILSRFVTRWFAPRRSHTHSRDNVQLKKEIKTANEAILHTEVLAAEGTICPVWTRDECFLDGCKEDRLPALKRLLEHSLGVVRCPATL